MKKNNSYSIKILTMLSLFLFLGSIIGTLFSIVINTGTIIAWNESVKPLQSISLPHNLDITNTLNITSNYDITVTGKLASITIDNSPLSIRVFYSIINIIIMVLFTYSLFLFYKFISSIYEGKYFNKSNIRSLKQFSNILILIWLIALLSKIITEYILFQKIGLTLYLSVGEDIKMTGLIIALFVKMFSHIIEQGFELQEENNLTV